MDHRPIALEPERWLEFCEKRTNAELFANLLRLDAGEAQALAAILAHLAELDVRRAAAETSHPTLFAYCTKVLGYSEAEAFLRIRAARQAKRFPRILSMIGRRQIHVTAVAKLAPHLTPDNYRGLLDRASRRTTRELDRLISELAPVPERRAVIRSLSVGPRPAPIETTASQGGLFAQGVDVPSQTQERSAREVAPACAQAPSAAPPAAPAQPQIGLMALRTPAALEGRVLFSFVVDESVRAEYERAREVMRHKFPAGRPEQIFAAALKDLLDRRDPERRLARKEKRRAQRRARQGARDQ